MRSSLSWGSLASIELVSRMIPRNWITGKGPSVLGSEMGTFKFLKVRSILASQASMTD